MENNDKLISLRKTDVSETTEAEIVEGKRPVSLDVKYEAGHSYKESWEYTELHCPSCGNKSVWMNSGPGDVEVGPEHLCTNCESNFYMPSLGKADDYQDKQRLEAIKKWE